MKSPFKFLDSCTKDDREIFFSCDSVFPRPGILPEDTIPPFQGLNVCMSASSHWTLPNAKIFCAYSAKKNADKTAVKSQNLTSGNYVSLSRRNSRFNYALNGQYIIKKDSVLSGTNTILSRPERAIYYKTGQRPVYMTHNDNKPCKGVILYASNEIPLQVPR